MRRRRLLVALAGLAVVIAAGVVVLWPHTHRTVTENYVRIEQGMTRTQVETILGPPGDYRTGPAEPETVPVYFSAEGAKVVVPDVWKCDDTLVYVAYDLAGCVMDKTSFANKRRTQSPFDNFLWRAKRLWHRWFP
jgi:hypothetical protein